MTYFSRSVLKREPNEKKRFTKSDFKRVWLFTDLNNMYLSYHEEKLTAERRAEIKELTKQFQS